MRSPRPGRRLCYPSDRCLSGQSKSPSGERHIRFLFAWTGVAGLPDNTLAQILATAKRLRTTRPPNLTYAASLVSITPHNKQRSNCGFCFQGFHQPEARKNRLLSLS